MFVRIAMKVVVQNDGDFTDGNRAVRNGGSSLLAGLYVI